MARGKHITEFERDVIRIGLHHGRSGAEIGAFLGRTKEAIYAQRDKMKAAGTLDNLPLPFVADEIAQAMSEEIAEAIRRGARRNA